MTSSIIPAIFMDWAGTAVDHGSIAPVIALEKVFAEYGIVVPQPLIRRYMGLAKRDHIRKLLEEPEIAEFWTALHHAAPEERDVDAMYANFEPQMMEALGGYATVITGVAETVQGLRAQGMRIAGTTGYTRAMLDSLETLAAKQGYHTDRSLAPEDAGGGRPYPWMCYRLAMELRIYPLHNCVKIGDTESDIAEGLNAGMWTIGVTRSGNTVGLAEAEWATTGSADREKLLHSAEQELRSAGAHYTIETVVQVQPVLEEIKSRIGHGERPR